MNRSLFSKLLSLHTTPVPVENFFTEVIAHTFQQHPELTIKWAKDMLGLTGSYTECSVSTQEWYGRLENHSMDSMVDLAIHLSGEEGGAVILIESKLGSSEGPDQLKRYAEHLVLQYPDANERVLVYITQYSDPKDRKYIEQELCKGNIGFIQLRWGQVYQYLLPYKTDPRIQEVTQFMEERRMDPKQQFSMAEVLAFSQAENFISLMEEVLSQDLQSRFAEIIGSKTLSRYDGLKNGRFVVQKQYNGWYCGLGFYIPRHLEVYPTVRLHFGMDIRMKTKNPEMFQAFQNISERTGWRSKIEPHWFSLYHGTGLVDFLPYENQVAEIRKYLFTRLEELPVLIKTYPQIPWGAPEAPESDPLLDQITSIN